MCMCVWGVEVIYNETLIRKLTRQLAIEIKKQTNKLKSLIEGYEH